MEAAETIRKIPTAFKINEIIKNLYGFILEIPIRLTPTSSGSGEAIIMAPITGKVQLKYFERKIAVRCFPPKRKYKGIISLKRPLRTNLNIVKSPITAPRPAITPISIGDKFSARINKTKAPVVTVNVETKSIPARNAPTYPKLPKFNNKL